MNKFAAKMEEKKGSLSEDEVGTWALSRPPLIVAMETVNKAAFASSAVVCV